MDNPTANRSEDRATGAVLIVLVAIVGHLPALGGYWNQDDWGQLARATGLSPTDWSGARLLSQTIYWKLLHPLFGLATQPWAWTRLLLHAGSALLVWRIGGRLMPAGAARVAGLIFAATPLSFTPLYWASGVQELMGAVLGLAAVERVLAGRTRSLVAAGLLGFGSMLAKENALLLPVLAGGLAAFGPREKRAGRALLAAVLAAAALYAGWRVLAQFPHGAGAPYGLGDPRTMLLNLTQYGCWLVSPWPVFTARYSLAVGLVGLAPWVGWIWLGWRDRHRGVSLQAALAGAALLTLLPALPLRTHLQPYLAYLAAAPLALALSDLMRRAPRAAVLSAPRMSLILAALLAAYAWAGMEYRLSRRDATGAPADPLVLRTSLSHATLHQLRSMPAVTGARVAILQVPPRGTRPQPGVPTPTPLYMALAGRFGPQLAGHPDMDVIWSDDLFRLPFTTLVLADASHWPDVPPQTRHWDMAHRAHIYLALSLIGQARFAEARDVMLTGMTMARESLPFVYDPDQLLVAEAAVRENAQAFLELIPVSGLPREQADKLSVTTEALFGLCGLMPAGGHQGS